MTTALLILVVATSALTGQGVVSKHQQSEDAKAFKTFSARVADYMKLQAAVEKSLPPLKETDLPQVIVAHQLAMAARLRAARPRAKAGDVFSESVREAFRHASRTVFQGPDGVRVRAYMQAGGPNPLMVLVVNGSYPATEPVTSLPPALLAAFPILPDGVAYRVVGRRLILVDVKSHLIIDVRLVLPPPA